MAQDLLAYEEIHGETERSPLLILLHGLGANEHDLLPLVDYIARGWHALSVRAPYGTPFGGWAWYDFVQGAGPERESYRKAVGDLDRFVKDARASNPGAPIVLLGFSQGALMALSEGTLRPAGLAAVVALSGYLPKDDLLPAPAERLKGLPVFQAHAQNDYMLPFDLALEAKDRLVRAGADLTWLEHDGGHSIPLSALDRLGSWLGRVGARTRQGGG
ncbi:MAG TPA: alpha/beta hydrolase [Candidatus Thermoplasmatota archaeon]